MAGEFAIGCGIVGMVLGAFSLMFLPMSRATRLGTWFGFALCATSFLGGLAVLGATL